MPVLATVVLKKSKHKKDMDAQNKKLFYQVWPSTYIVLYYTEI
jgi:hypothetical protein